MQAGAAGRQHRGERLGLALCRADFPWFQDPAMLNTLHLDTMRGNDASVSSSPIRCGLRLSRLSMSV